MAIAATLPPGPKGQFLLGNLAEFRKDILAFYTRLATEFGDCASFRLGSRRDVLVSNPEWIERILITDSRNFAKMTFVLNLLVPLLGNGLLTSDRDFWLRQRRLMQPAFSRTSIAAYAPPMVEYALRLLDRWTDGQTLDIHEEMMRLALEIVAKVLFDADVTEDTDEVGDALWPVMHNFLNRWARVIPMPAWVPTRSNLRYHHSVRRLNRLIYRFIAQRRAAKEQKNDLLSILLHARDEDDGSRMTDKQLRDEAMTLFLAGHETTALALAFTWYLLAQHPDEEARLREEVHMVIGRRPPAVEDVPKLKFTEAVVLETMRLYPPAYSFGRTAKSDYQLGPYLIPAKTTIIVSQWVMHRHENYWDEPEVFRPQRWLDGSTKNLPKFAYFPFGGGPRKCIGDSFAMMESILILAAMIPKVHLDLVKDHPVVLRPAVVIRPEFGIKMKVRKIED